MSAALSLFQQFQSQGEDLINQMVAEGEQETLHLDFKRAASNHAPMEEGDRKTLAEAISGFANSEGGIIVWGVDCKRGDDGVDQARTLEPIQKLSRWLNDLNKYTSSVVSPSDVPVEHFSIPKAGQADSGYAVTYVPRWDGLPIMAIARKKDQYSYFFRSGDSFTKMEAFMVADRYGRRPRANLMLSVQKGGRGDGEATPIGEYSLPPLEYGQGRVVLTLGIHNVGTTVAKFPALEILDRPLHGFKPIQENFGLPMKYRFGVSRGTLFGGGQNDVIYPGDDLRIARFYRDVYTMDLLQPRPTELAYSVYCDGFQHSDSILLDLRAILEGRET